MAATSSEDLYHGTNKELEFLKGLGTGEFNHYVVTPRLELLKKYKKSIRLRKRWGCIKKEKIVNYLNREIDRLEE